MSKELEALDRLWKETKGNQNTSSMSNRSDRDLIKSALIRYQELKETKGVINE